MKPFIIAEAGVNHSGFFEKAMDMMGRAENAGANAIKFQTFWNLGCLEIYEFTKEKWKELHDYCSTFYNIEFMTTPHWGSPLCGYKDEDYEVIDFVDTLVKRHKVASPYLTNKKYIKYIASKGKPLIISTGSIKNPDKMATLKEIETMINWIPNTDITLLHCVSEYPVNNRHLERIEELKVFGFPVGVSDHTQNICLPNLPVIEKHFKLDENCIDANVSINPKQLKELCQKYL